MDIDELGFQYCPKCKDTVGFLPTGHRHVKEKNKKSSKKIVEVFENKVQLTPNNETEDPFQSIIIEEKLVTKQIGVTNQKFVSEILECPECRTILFLQFTLIDESLDGNPIVYPSFQDWNINVQMDMKDLLENKDLFTIYQEAIFTFNNSNFLSTAVVLRTLLEQICKEFEVKGRDLKTKINNLALDEIYKKALHNIREIGNSAAHDAYFGNQDELKNAVFGLELLIRKLYTPKWEIKKFDEVNTNLESHKISRR